MKKEYFYIGGAAIVALLFFNRKKLTDMKLSKNFSLSEFSKSQTAKEKGINNEIPSNLIPNVKLLVDKILQPARDALGVEIRINSGYRSPALNTAIGGVTNSQHKTAQAVDIESSNNMELFNWIKQNVEFDQLIHEYGSDYMPDWVHVSLKPNGNRNQVLRVK